MNSQANDIYRQPETLFRGGIFPDSMFKQVVRERSQSGQRDHVKRCPIRILSLQGVEAAEISTPEQRPFEKEENLKQLLPRISSIESNVTACSEAALARAPSFTNYNEVHKEVAP